MTTYYARVDYSYSGDSYFTIPFSYIKKEHIVVLVNDVKTTNYTYITSSQIEVKDELEAEDVVSIRRTTPIKDKLVSFTNLNVLNGEIQNLAQTQVLNAVQEIYDSNTQFEITTNKKIEDNKSDVDTQITNYKSDVDTQITNYKSDVDTQITNYKSDVDTQITNYKSDVDTQITNYKSDVDTQITNYKSDVDTKVAAVSNAVKQLEILDEKVETATTAAVTASDAADNATAQATIAANKAEEVAEKVEELEALANQVEEVAEKVEELEALANQVETNTTDLAQEIIDRTNADNIITTAYKTYIHNMLMKSTGVYSPSLNFLKTGSTHTSLKISKDTRLQFKLGELYYEYFTDIDVEFNVIKKLDTGTALQAGKDYCVYIYKTEGSFDFKVSLNSTYPDNMTANTVYKIGGFHTLCLSVTTANAPRIPSDSWFTSHTLIGYNTADILPNSVWCLIHRPVSEPNGMVYVDRIRKWVDIYLQSGTLSNTVSVFNGTTTDTRPSILHQLDMISVYKKLPTDNDFLIFAEGSNQLTSITGAKDAVTTGGHLDTAGMRMVSCYGVEDCCGFLWQWLDEIGFNGQTNWTSYSTGAMNRGQSYGMPYVLLAGGAWIVSSSCGSWSRACSTGRSDVSAYFGCRGVSLPLFEGKLD